jgi:hypothetical protein
MSGEGDLRPTPGKRHAWSLSGGAKPHIQQEIGMNGVPRMALPSTPLGERTFFLGIPALTSPQGQAVPRVQLQHCRASSLPCLCPRREADMPWPQRPPGEYALAAIRWCIAFPCCVLHHLNSARTATL